MKIAFIYKYFPSAGGVERVMTILANNFVRENIQVTIFSMEQRLTCPPYPIDERVVYDVMPNHRRIDSEENKTFLENKLRHGNYDIIFNHDTTADTMQLCKYLKSSLSLPLVTLHHGQIYLPKSSLKSIAEKHSKYNLRNLLFPLYLIYDRVRRTQYHKNNIRISDKYVLLSESFRRQLLTENNKEKLVTINNPLSFDTFFDINDYTNKENIILMVGRLSETHKRFSLALQVWSRIEKQSEFNSWNFYIIGDGPDKQFIENEIKRLDLKRVKLTGQANPEPYYRRAKIYFMVSAYEGFCLVLPEAQQNGCVPIAMNSFESLTDIITNNVNGIIITNNDVDGFTNAAISLMTDKEKIYSLAKNSLSTCANFQASNIVKKWKELFSEILASRNLQ